MICQLDFQSDIPIYEQICRQVKFAIGNGTLHAGDHVPSVRELAVQAAVNVNTVARAYRDLQAQGILVSIRGTGLAVSPEAPSRCRDDRLEMIRERLSTLLREAILSGIEVEEIRHLVDVEWSRLHKEVRSSKAV